MAAAAFSGRFGILPAEGRVCEAPGLRPKNRAIASVLKNLLLLLLLLQNSAEQPDAALCVRLNKRPNLRFKITESKNIVHIRGTKRLRPKPDQTSESKNWGVDATQAEPSGQREATIA
jgi:hypothetical protein